MLRHSSLWVVCCALLTGVARADVVQFQFDGTITSASGNFSGTPFAGVNSGSLYTLTYTFESGTPDSVPDPTLGLFDNAMLSIQLQVGAGLATDLSSGDIEIANNFAGVFDAYQLDIGLMNGLDVGLLLQDFTQSAFSSDALPTNLQFNGFTNRLFTITGPNGSMTGNVTGFALPAPGAAIVAIAVLIPGVARRRR